ncbi:fatty acid desaturase [Verminephrobacter eiseniae]|uniref:fatty acid desaturase n=1 Tax=Verminephrobacter eiseniae TaxID=364317 RepID=UPI00223885C2|nr:fatty acid desaturase [Verminephrobacter eiseniae]
MNPQGGPKRSSANARHEDAPVNAPAPVHPDYATRYSRYGHGIDVRATYAHLPAQWLWTWITGKSLREHAPRAPKETWRSELGLWGQLAWSWSLIVLGVLLGSWALYASVSMWIKVPACIFSWVLVVNRTRGLLHTFHYTNHGATIADMRRARWIGRWFMSIPILHTSWINYHKLHAEVHHGANDLCTDNDPDQQFMTQHGFYYGMPEREYWLRLIYAPFLPRNLWAHFWFRVQQNFIVATREEIVCRTAFWVVFLGVSIATGTIQDLTLFYLFPLFVLTQHSSWIQHTTEHLWFPRVPEDTSRFVAVGAMTWGRFQGRPHPGHGRGPLHWLRLLKWWSLIVLIDIPIRLYSFMQDLPSHDFHHRAPRVSFWSIARERAANEGLPSKFGPMTETWGIFESWQILRDHLCRQAHDPFGVFAWDAEQRGPVRRDRCSMIPLGEPHAQG